MWQDTNVLQKFNMSESSYRLFLVVVLMWSDVQLQWSGSELVEGRSQLEAVLEQ